MGIQEPSGGECIGERGGKIAFCQDCGARLVNPKATRCWPCWSKWRVGRTTRKRIYSRICETCGGKVVNPYSAQCRTCWKQRVSKDARYCIDCGTKLSTTVDGRPDQRCWSCYKALREANRQQCCTIDGCTQPFYAKGMCRSHYQVGRRTALWGNKVIDRNAHYTVKLQPCAACGYSRMRSEVHRFVPKGPYVVGNMVPLCARCHDEVERGLIPCPPAWQP